MKPKFNLKLELIESKWRSRLVHLQLTVKPNVIFSCTCQGRQELVTINSWVRSIKKHLRDVNVSQKCVSSEKKLLLARIGLSEITKAAISRYASNIVHNLVRDSDLRVRKCQYPPHKNRRRKVEREVNLRMAEEIKAGGESSWWQGDCKPNRTCTVTAILESAMNKEEGQQERLSEHQFF